LNLLSEDKIARFREAATTGDLPTLLREDYLDILLSAYGTVPQPLLGLCYQVTSDNPSETYRGLKHLQDIDSEIPEGSEYPEIIVGEKSTVTITNRKYGAIIAVTEEMIRYSKLAEMTRIGASAGEMLGRVVEKKIAAAIEDTSNTTASGSTLTLSRANLETVVNAFRIQTATAADGTTIKLGLTADTLLVPPSLEYDATRILNSTLIPGSANNDVNVMKGALNIMVAPYLTSTSLWYVLKSNWANGLVIQKVIGPPPELSQQEVKGNQQPDSTFRYDKISYKARMLFGVGVIDAKFCIRSTT